MKNPHVHVPYEGIEDYLGFIKENRINLELYCSSHVLDGLQVSDIKRLKERLDYEPSFTVHAPFMDLSPGAVDSEIRAITLKRFSQVLDIAEVLKARAAVFHSGYERWKYALNIDLWLEKSLITWKSLLPRAVDKGVRIAIENIFEDEPSNLRLLAEEMDSEYFGICFDTGHFNLFSKFPLGDWLRQLKPYLIELHLHDNNKTFDDHFAIGEGSFDFAALFSMVEESHLIYTIEAHSAEGVLKSINTLQQYR
jgi:sugar phosphate isomerase/epimerase